jgi:hypothetical protein
MKIGEIAQLMREEGLETDFINEAVRKFKSSDEFRHLLNEWAEEPNIHQREFLLAEIEELIENMHE